VAITIKTVETKIKYASLSVLTLLTGDRKGMWLVISRWSLLRTHPTQPVVTREKKWAKN